MVIYSFFNYWLQKRLFSCISNFLPDLSPKTKNELSYLCKQKECFPGSFKKEGFL
jgi:hypothetical protein